MKTRIYAAPAVKGLTDILDLDDYRKTGLSESFDNDIHDPHLAYLCVMQKSIRLLIYFNPYSAGK